MIKKILFIILIILIPRLQLYAQSIDDWIAKNEKLPVEKIYLHTNKEFYFNSETIWFNAYLTDSRSGKIIPGAENIYVNLIGEDGTIPMKSVVININGQAPGNFSIPEDIKPGNYLLEAFTDYLLNFTPDAFFYKPIHISRVTPSSRLIKNEERFSRTQRMVGDVSFLPEGGIILTNVSNLVAFKAINTDGYGVEAEGFVKDENGNIIVEFQTDYKGMGLFFFEPKPDKSYTANIKGFPSFKYNFKPLIVNEGIKLQVINHSSSDLIINVAANTEKYIGKKFYLVNMHQGEVIFYQAFKNEGKNHVLKFNSQNLKGGINSLILLDKELKPVSERLVFSNNLVVNNLHVATDQTSYNKRSLVKLKVIDENQLSPSEYSNLSVSVLHENAISPFGISQNILSYMLINSELNGFVEQSVDFFIDTEISSLSKLRLLMLTNGWSNYFWNSSLSASDTLKYKQKAGIDIEGTAFNITTENPLENGEITLIIEKKGEMAFLTQKTNNKGEFRFPGLLFNDTAKVFIQAKNKKGRMNTNISLSTVFPNPQPSKIHIKSLSSFYETPFILKKQKYEGDLAMKEFDPYYKTRNIDQVDVIEEKPQNDNRFRIYDEPDVVLEIQKNESSYSNVLEYMTGKVAGLDIFLDDVKIRGMSDVGNNSTPLFLIDGIPILSNANQSLPDLGSDNSDDEGTSQDYQRKDNSVVATVKSIPMQDIEKVEILKSPQKLALFGSEGANGVIAIYTHRGVKPEPSPFIKGLLERNIQGYTSNKTFYSPKYTPENRTNSKPDLRTTLFWNPEVLTKNGAAELNFFTSDHLGSYTIFVEGISSAGKICLGTANFDVLNDDGNSFGQVR